MSGEPARAAISRPSARGQARLGRALRFRLIQLLVFSAWSTLASCKPSVGSSCAKGEARCLDERRELACQAGIFLETPCHGPAGCRSTEQGTVCDFSGNKSGDPCSADDEGAATCTNQDGMLACHAGSYALLPCRGSRGCVNAEGRALCDTSVAEPGDACHDENLKGCSSDATAVLICRQHSMQRFYWCRGPSGCTASAGKLSCDTSIARLGDACDKKLEGQAFSCTPDASAILVCKGGAFALDQTCKSGQQCLNSGSSTACAKPSH